MTNKTEVINISDLQAVRAAMDSGRYVYCGRGGIYGNYFAIGIDGNREEVIAKHRDRVLNNPEMVKEVYAGLLGKVLGCHCKPKTCHCDLYADICNNPIEYGLVEPGVDHPAMEPYFRSDGPAVILCIHNGDDTQRWCRIAGWSGVVNERGEEVPFSPQTAAAIFESDVGAAAAAYIMNAAEACGLATTVHPPEGAGEVITVEFNAPIIGG
jgi:hypothetical protein